MIEHRTAESCDSFCRFDIAMLRVSRMLKLHCCPCRTKPLPKLKEKRLQPREAERTSCDDFCTQLFLLEVLHSCFAEVLPRVMSLNGVHLDCKCQFKIAHTHTHTHRHTHTHTRTRTRAFKRAHTLDWFWTFEFRSAKGVADTWRRV